MTGRKASKIKRLPNTKTEKSGVLKRLTDMFELPKEVVFNMPVIQATGCEDVVVTNYKGLVEYNDECVRISTGAGMIRLEGHRLKLCRVTSEAVNVNGRVKKIEFLN